MGNHADGLPVTAAVAVAVASDNCIFWKRPDLKIDFLLTAIAVPVTSHEDLNIEKTLKDL